MRTSLDATRCAVAVAISCAAILAGATACGTTASGHSTPAASAKPSVNPLAGLTAEQIARRASADLRAVSSVHVTGWGEGSGQSAVVDLTLGTKGCTGTFRIQGEGSFVLLKIGKMLWIKPDNQFWKSVSRSSSDPALLKVLEGKYLRTSAHFSGLNSIGMFCDPRQFAGDFGGPVNDLVKGKTTTIFGQPALQLTDIRHRASAYVTISARPDFLRIDAGSQGHLDFTGYNAPMSLTPPPAAETVDGSKYGF